MIFFLQFSLNFSDLLIRVLAEKVLDQFLRLCQKKLFGAKNREGVVICKHCSWSIWSVLVFSFGNNSNWGRNGWEGYRKGFLLFLAASLVLLTKILTIVFTFYLFACS